LRVEVLKHDARTTLKNVFVTEMLSKHIFT